MMTLEQAISIASLAHEGQLDKGGEPYILHPLRVMMKFKDEKQRIVAVLHDVVEDTKVTIQDLILNGLDRDLANVVLILTRRRNESYDDYINRICYDELAMRVKLADLNDNMDMSRIDILTEKDYQRLAKYRVARKTLENILFG